MPTNTVPTGNHYISVEDAAVMTERYRANLSTVLKQEYVSSNVFPLSETFNKAAFAVFMENNDCKAIRLYYGMDENLLVHAIIVGVNEFNEDILPGQLLNDNEDVFVLEDAVRCPYACPPDSELNTDDDPA